MRIALATALALCLAAPALTPTAQANENLALFLEEHRAAQALEQDQEPEQEQAAATPAATEAEAGAAPVDSAKSFFLMDAAHRAGEPATTGSTSAAAAPAAAAPAAAAGSVQAMVTQAALRHGIDPILAHAMARTESNYRCSAVGRAGELGVMQVKPATARSVGVTGNLRDCATGIEAGMRYLRAALDRHGTGCGGISAYNMGIHRASSFCNGYGRKVMARMAQVEVAALR